MDGLKKIGSLVVPDNPTVFHVGKFVRHGAPGIKEVGAKLAAEIQHNQSSSVSNGGPVSFYRASAEEAGDIPYELRNRSPLSWWQLYWALQWPDDVLFRALQYKDQIGCAVRHDGNRRVVRIKLGWKEGHSIGGRPIEPKWAWKEGTIFAVRER